METLLIDPKSQLPLHAQVEQLLRQLIRDPRYRDGQLLPDEVGLAVELGISRGTVRTAITRLVAEGLLERRPGVGTRAIKCPAESAIATWRSISKEMAARGITVETFQLNCRKCPATKAVANALIIEPGSSVLRLDRLRGWENDPVLHSRSWFHPRLNLKEIEGFDAPLYEFLEAETGVVADSAREELLAVPADSRMARLLRVPKRTPILLQRYVVLDRGHRPFEFAEVHYVSQRYTLSIDLQRGNR